MAELRQLDNQVEIVGYLKSIDVHVNDGEQFKGSIIVEVHEGDKIHNHRVDINHNAITRSGTASKSYKSYLTMVDKYKTRNFIEEAGLDEKPDLVKVSGDIVRNQYYNNKGEFKDFNNIRGLFINREKDLSTKHYAKLTAEVVVESFENKKDENDSNTGDISVKLYTNNYRKEPQYIKGAFVGAKLAPAFTQMYPVGSTARLTMKLNNYVVVTDIGEKEEPNAFGEEVAIKKNKVVKDFVNNVEIVSGKAPYTGSEKFTPEMIAESKQIWNTKKIELHADYIAIDTPQVDTKNPFGGGDNPFGNNDKIDISEDDLPF